MVWHTISYWRVLRIGEYQTSQMLDEEKRNKVISLPRVRKVHVVVNVK